MFKIVLHKNAAKKLAKFPGDLRSKILKAIDSLSIDPYAGKKLHGELEGSCRIRIGDFRIIYDIHQNDNIVVVHAIGSRGDVYK